MCILMSLLKYPIEILENIGEYLDIFDILKLLCVDRYCYYVFNGKINKKIQEYLSMNDLSISNINDIDNQNKLFYIHVIFYIKRCIESGDFGFLNITFMKIFSGNKNCNYKIFRTNSSKCVYFLKNLQDFSNSIDGLENFLLTSKVNNRQIVKNDDMSNLSNASDIIFLYRINYNEIIEKTPKLDRNEIIERTPKLDHNEIIERTPKLDRNEIIEKRELIKDKKLDETRIKEDLIMVTFYFFL